MSENDPYAVVLNDLRAQRDKIDNAIAAIEALRGHADGAMALAKSAQGHGAAIIRAEGPGAFLGLTIVDAAKKLLARERRQLNNAEIVEKLKSGGLVLNSADAMNTVGSVLNRRFIQVGDVVRVARGTWGLKEWYPNRSFKPSAKSDDPSRPTDQDLNDLGLGESVRAPSIADLIG